MVNAGRLLLDFPGVNAYVPSAMQGSLHFLILIYLSWTESVILQV